MKKGQISIQFNWIFVIIVGAIILTFFLMIVKSQTKSADIELAGDIVQNLDTIVKSSEQSGQALKIIDIPNVGIEFACEPDISYYSIGNSVSKNTPYDIIFTQKNVKGNKLISLTQVWKLPFKIATFQYITTRNTLFIFINDSNMMGENSIELYSMLPANFSKIYLQPTDEINDLNFDFYKIIQFRGNEVLKPIHLPDGKYEIITINTTNLDTYGEINFSNEGETVKFVKKELLLGAIFSEGSEFYKCTMRKALNRLKTLMTLNIYRVNTLINNMNDASCITLYGRAKDALQSINNSIDDDLTNYEDIYQNSESLAGWNNNLMRGKNCPLIY